MPVNPNGTACRCGSVGCWETEVGEAGAPAAGGPPAGRRPRRGRCGPARGRAGLAAAPRARSTTSAAGSGSAWPASSTSSTRELIVLGGLFGRIHPFVAEVARGGARSACAVRARAGSSGSSRRASAPMHRCSARPSSPSNRCSPTRPLAADCARGRSTVPGERLKRSDAIRPQEWRVSSLAGIPAFGFEQGIGTQDEEERTNDHTPNWRRSSPRSRDRRSRHARSSGATARRKRHRRRGDRAAAAGGLRAGCTVGVSWNNFQQPRWAAQDKPTIQKTVEAGGGTYIDADANLKNEQQLTDIDTLINRGRQGPHRARPGHEGRSAGGRQGQGRRASRSSPTTASSRTRALLYITFDNTDVGKAEADAILKKVPKGNYVLIKGDPGDANATTFLPAGWDQAGLKDKVASGDIKIIGPADGTYTDAWETEKAQTNMEAIIDAANSTGQEDRRGPGRERQHGARRRRRAHGEGLRLPAAQRPGRRHRQPEQRRAGQAVRRRLEERQRARQDRRAAALAAVRRRHDGQPQARRTACRPGGRSGRRASRPDVHDAGWQHRPVVHPAADPDHRGQPPGRHRRGQITKEELCKGVDARQRRRGLQVAVNRQPSTHATCAPGPRGRRSLQRPDQEGRR